MSEFEEYDERADIERGEMEGLKPFIFVVAFLVLSFFLDLLW